MTQPNPDLQQHDISELVKRLADLRGQQLDITTLCGSATSAVLPGGGNAIINGKAVSFEVMRDPSRVITMLLRDWNQPIILNGAEWHSGAGKPEDADQIVVQRQSLPLAGQPEMGPPRIYGAPQPTVRALGVEFSVPHAPGYRDWRQRLLGAEDPDTRTEHFSLNVWMDVIPRITLSDAAARECRFLVHEDIPYLDLGPLAKSEAAEQIDQAVAKAVRRVEQITGATDFQPARNEGEAAGSHPAYTCAESVRLNLRSQSVGAKMAHGSLDYAVVASFARAMYLNPDARLVPLQGHYGNEATVTVVPMMVRAVSADGGVSECDLSSRQWSNPKATGNSCQFERVSSISLLMEIRPLVGGRPVEERWLEADLMVSGYGEDTSVILSDRFVGNVDELTDLLVHMSAPYRDPRTAEIWEHRMERSVVAHRALGDEDAAFQTELDIMVLKFLRNQRVLPKRDQFTVLTRDGTFTWRRSQPEAGQSTVEESAAELGWSRNQSSTG